jgi:hypothetical protein
MNEENRRREEFMREDRQREEVEREHRRRSRQNQFSSDRWPEPEEYHQRVHNVRYPRQHDEEDRRDQYENPGR